MNYPLISEYIETIKLAEENFDKLKNLRPVLNDDGEPVMSSGNFAVVFKMRDEQTGKLHAVKCFLKEQEGRAEAYHMIAEELEYVNSTFLTPIRYLDKELIVDTKNSYETEFPVLLMDWVEGMTLDKYIREHIGNQFELSFLAYQFSQLAMWLMPQPFAHGDLKPDNILVKNDGTLVLVDYDGMYVPAMKGQKARELGSPDFRHPSRTENDFDEHIDDFSLASILLSLKAISIQPELLEQYGASDRLLFSEKDYLNLSECSVMDALKPFMEDFELASLLMIFSSTAFHKNLSFVSLRFFNLSKPDENLSSKAIENNLESYGKIVNIDERKYLLIYDIKDIFEVADIEEEAIDGLRIVEFIYKQYIEVFYKNYKNKKIVKRYGLVNEKGELVSNYHYTSLDRQDNGNISAYYSDPCDSHKSEARFRCILNTKGNPLFKYQIKTKDGNIQLKTFPLINADAVSSCFYGIAIFVKNHKIGVIDYKGNVLIKPVYDDVKIDKDIDCLIAVLYDKKPYEGFNYRPPETLAGSVTYLYQKSDYWPLHLHKLNSCYYVKSFDKGLYYLENKKSHLVCLCHYDGYNVLISPEYKSLSPLNYWYYIDNKNTKTLHMAINRIGKYGIISMPTYYDEVDPMTGNPIYDEIREVCRFDYDYIFDSLDNIILVKDGKEGIYSCSQKKFLLDCVIPTIDQYFHSIILSTLGEGLIGCKERIKSSTFSSKYRFLFYDLHGNKILQIPEGWEIISGFENGFATIRSGGSLIKTAKIDLAGNITIIKEEWKNNVFEDDEFEDYDRMYRDVFEDDPNMEWNID